MKVEMSKNEWKWVKMSENEWKWVKMSENENKEIMKVKMKKRAEIFFVFLENFEMVKGVSYMAWESIHTIVWFISFT